jgi:hypothetical protein
LTHSGSIALTHLDAIFGGGTPQPCSRPFAAAAGGHGGATRAVGAHGIVNVVFAPPMAATVSRSGASRDGTSTQRSPRSAGVGEHGRTRQRSVAFAGYLGQLAVGLAGCLIACCAFARSPQGDGVAAAASTAHPSNTNLAGTDTSENTHATRATGAAIHYQPNRFAGRAGTYYRVVWGVDSLAVKWVESGELIRFSYRVLDADSAEALNDKKSEPMMLAPRAGVSLVVPAMENVGQLRQSTDAEDGKSYWMVFSNKGRLVKRGDRVNVVIGQFRADGLVVD